jgi:hypothetical protein
MMDLLPVAIRCHSTAARSQRSRNLPARVRGFSLAHALQKKLAGAARHAPANSNAI